ncbi:MAG: FtsW/RodA/SpoVE family cell cycle protein, partial [Geovibrio sp.]|nr:FtsW/RodA/SpoVE family cell cycle protein [Geovibrio sp.]
FFAAVSAAVFLPVMWMFFLKDYQRQRVMTFLDPEKDPFGSGYHVIQSKIGIGSGGIWGKGFMEGTQSHLKFIPERHTDFIFSVVAEETGLVGAAIVICMFLFMIVRVLSISMETREASGKVICVAVAAYIFFQFFVNSAMTMGIMPVVGIPPAHIQLRRVITAYIHGDAWSCEQRRNAKIQSNRRVINA